MADDPAMEVDYDPFSPAVMADPFPAYSTLRSECPVHRFEGFDPPFLTVTRHADVVAMLRDVDTWSSHYGQSPRFTVAGCLFSDPPTHTTYRRLVQQGFAPRVVERLTDDISALAEELVGGMLDHGDRRGDLHDDVACPLPVLVIARVLGVPTDRIAEFKEWSDRQVEAMNSSDPEASAATRAKLDAFFTGQLDDRRALLDAAGVPRDDWSADHLGSVIPDDVIGGLLVVEADGRRLSDPELLTILQQLLVGGNETTTSLITNMFWRLLTDRSLYEQVRDEPALDALAVEESLRLDAPVLGLFRTNTRPLTMHGVDIAEQTKAMATFAAANRDPEVFDHPDEFRLDRDLDELRRKHLAFGAGHHFCPGAHLSRIEARITLRTIANRAPDLQLDGDTTRIGTFLLWGRRSLPVRW